MRASSGQLNIICAIVDCKMKLIYYIIHSFSGFAPSMHLLKVHSVFKKAEKISYVCCMSGHKPALTLSYINSSEILKGAKCNCWTLMSQRSRALSKTKIQAMCFPSDANLVATFLDALGEILKPITSVFQVLFQLSSFCEQKSDFLFDCIKLHFQYLSACLGYNH